MSKTEDDSSPIRLGVIGLGRAFTLTRPAFQSDKRVRLIAASDPRDDARKAYETEFGGRAYETAEQLCGDPSVEAVYIATPHELHRPHLLLAAAAGKHILVEKPLAITIEDARIMVDACAAAGVKLLVGPSHSYDTPIKLARSLIEAGEIGRVRLINAFNYTDFLYRPRRPEELQTERGGGVVFLQGIHQIDIVRLLAGGLAQEVFALTGQWDPNRRTEGAYTALLSFKESMACLTYSGYAHFDSDEWMDSIGESGVRKNPSAYGSARLALGRAANTAEEIRLKAQRTYGTEQTRSDKPESFEHFGPIIVSCDRADLRIAPSGIHIYNDTDRTFRATPRFQYPRLEVADALLSALRGPHMPAQTGAWGLASLEVCHAIVQAAKLHIPVSLKYQVGS